MILRRAVFAAMFPAAILAPIAALILHAVFQAPGAAETLAAFVLSLLGFVALAAISILIVARRRVRDEKAVSWPDVGILVALVAAVVLSGALDTTIAPVAAAVLAIGGFWLAVWELVTETRNRLRAFVGTLDPKMQPTSPGPQRGDVYVIQPHETSSH